MSMTDQQKHDALMELRPEGATHDATGCMYCTVKASKEENVAESDVKLTQEQHEQLLSAAVERAEAEARAKADADVLSLNEQVEALTKERDELNDKLSELQRVIADSEEADRLSKLGDERAAAVKAVASFTDEQLEERKESWAKQDEEAFNAYLEDIQEVAKAAAKASNGDKGAPKTSFDGTRATAGEEGTEASVIAKFFSVSSASQS